MPASDLRRVLRGHGHALFPLVQVGKAGVTDALVQQVMQVLADHELVKVKVGGECPLDRHAVAARLDEEPGVDIVQIVGRILLLYKRHPRTPRFEGKRARDRQAPPSAARRAPATASSKGGGARRAPAARRRKGA